MKLPWIELDPTARRLYLGRRPTSRVEPALDGPDWMQASPWRIDRALRRSQARPSGGWYVVDGSRTIGATPRSVTIAGRELVVWRDGDAVLVAPDACPHMGARLGGAKVCHGRIVCPWHGLSLGADGHGRWRPTAAHDDGVLVWVRLEDGQAATPAPILPPRPAEHIDAVVRVEAACDPEDVIANRLDPWHGAWLHPYSFDRLVVTDADDDVLRMRVSYKIAGPLCIEVDVTFHSPEPRTIVMTIVDGDGRGSVVETHATPIAPGRTAIVEATLATSDRRGFGRVLPASSLIRPLMERAARRLWVDDVAYAERLYALRNGEQAPQAVRLVRPA